MKKWLYLTAVLTAVGVLSRLPHPARDIAELEPIRAVYISMDGERLSIETDTADSGSGPNLKEAYGNMKDKADSEIFLDTAEFLLLSPDVSITEAFYTIFRPDCKVIFTEATPDMKTVSDYFVIHSPEMTLADIRASNLRHENERSRYAQKTTHPLAPGCPGRSAGPFLRFRLAADRVGGIGCPAADGDPESME